MPATRTDLLDVAPELASESESRLDKFLELAALQVNARVFGAKTALAQALMAAHMLTLSNRKGGGGPLLNVKVGELSTTYGMVSVNSDSLQATPYGLMFKDLRAQVALPVVVG